MSKFYSTISRRDFMKGLGFAGLGLGAAAAASPVFHDLDELASKGTHNQHPWWVKENELEVLQTEVDWAVFKPVNASGYINTYSPPAEVRAKYYADGIKLYQDGINNNIPGLSQRDMALSWGARSCSPSIPWNGNWQSNIGNGSAYPANVTFGKWQGSPEDNLKMVRAAMHYYGSPRVGVLPVNEHMKRLLDGNEGDGYQFEDIPEGYRDDKYHFPSSCRSMITYVVKQEAMQNMYAIGEMGEVPNDYSTERDWKKISNKSCGGASSSRAYAEGPAIHYRLMRFLHGLGYHAYTPPARANVALGVFSGLVEESRSGQSMSPNYGIFMRYIRVVLTDMPLPPTKPIDFGAVDFCKSCKICAEVCPTGSVTMDSDTSWEGTGPWSNGGNNRLGFKGWYLNWNTCSDMGNPWNCTQCQSSCPFNSLDHAFAHDVVRATAGVTPIFDGFFANMEKVFGYCKPRHADDWWDRDLKTWPHDSLFAFGTAGW